MMQPYELSFTSFEDVEFTPNEVTQQQLGMLLEILRVAHKEGKFIFLKGGWNIDRRNIVTSGGKMSMILPSYSY